MRVSYSVQMVLAICGAVGVYAGIASGDVLFSQLNNSNTAWKSDADAGFSGSVFEQADSLSLPSDVVIESVRFWGVYREDATGATDGEVSADDFVLRIFADDGGVPAGSPLSEWSLSKPTRVLSGRQVAGVLTEYEYETILNPRMTLLVGEKCWVSIVNNTTNVPANSWGWSASADGDDDHAAREVSGRERLGIDVV